MELEVPDNEYTFLAVPQVNDLIVVRAGHGLQSLRVTSVTHIAKGVDDIPSITLGAKPTDA